MDGNQLFVSNWARRFCPTFLDLVSADSQFIALEVESNIGRFTQVFMRSTFSSWEAHPAYADILAGCTAEGRDFFDSMLRARVASAVVSAGGVLFGASGTASNLKSNAPAIGTARERLAAAVKTFVDNEAWPLLNTAQSSGVRMTIDQYQGLKITTHFLEKMREVGLADIQGPFTSLEALTSADANTASARATRVSDEVLTKCGPQRFPVHIMGDPAGSGRVGAANQGHVIAAPYFYTVAMIDDSIHEVGNLRVAGPGFTSSGQFITAGSATSVDFSSPEISETYDLVLALNPAYAPSYPKGVFGVARIDDHWLPLCVLPGRHELLVRAAPSSVQISWSSAPGPSVQRVLVATPDIVGVMPIQWYVDYANERVAAGAKNADQLAQAVEDMAPYLAKSITFIAYDKAEFLEENMVLLTQLYLDYKKAQEKACEDDVFLTLPFTKDVTYGALNTLINGSRSTRVFYGYRDAGEALAFAETLPASRVGWTLTGGGQTVTVRRPDGTFAPSIYKETGDELIDALASGATLSGATLTQQLTLWGYDPELIALQGDGLAASNARMRSGTTKGSGSAYYDFRWESVGMTGVPDVRHMARDTRYRATMISKGAIAALGAYLREILIEEVIAFYGNTLTAVTKP